MRELVRLARVNVINPMGRTFAKSHTTQLLPDFVAQRKRFRVRYDMSEVSVFQEDETEREQRIIARVSGGIMQVADAQDELGLQVDESQKVYLRQSSQIAVASGKDPTVAPVPAMPQPVNRLNGDREDPAEDPANNRLVAEN